MIGRQAAGQVVGSSPTVKSGPNGFADFGTLEFLISKQPQSLRRCASSLQTDSVKSNCKAWRKSADWADSRVVCDIVMPIPFLSAANIGPTSFTHLRFSTMTNLIWIDLEVAAGWLSSDPNEVMTLIRDGTLCAKRRRHANVVVRADDVRCLAEFWTVKTPRRPRPHFRNTPATRCKQASVRGASGRA